MKGKKGRSKRSRLTFVVGSILFAIALVASKRPVRFLIEEFRV